MLKRNLILLILCLMAANVLSQGIRDSVFELQTVEINIDRSFEKSEAGMKESRIDTIVMMQKINQSLGELLAENSPVFIRDHGRGALSSASFRGTAPSHTQVSWNGININTPMAGMVDFSLIPVFLMDEVNLKHGTASIADESGGLGGSVNISNRINWNEKPGIEYMQGIGSYNSFEEYLKVGYGNSKIRGRTRLYHKYSENDYTFINRGKPGIDPKTGEVIFPLDTNDHADYKVYGILQEVYYRSDQSSILSARWWWQDAERSIPRATSYEGPDDANISRQSDRDNRIVIDWKRFGKKDKLLLKTAYAGKKLIFSLKNRISGQQDFSAIHSESRQNSFLNSLAYNRQFKKNFALQSKLDFDFHDVETEDTVTGRGYAGQRSELSWLLSLQKSFDERLNLNLMLRQNLIEGKNYQLIPYLGFDYRLIRGNNLLLKGNIARNYHLPGLNALYWQPGGNPDLLPEKGLGMELGLEKGFTLKGHAIKAELTAFRNDINNWIIWLPGFKGYWEPKNIKRVLVRGIELYLQSSGSLGPLDYRLSGNYAYNSSVNYGDPLTWGDASYGKQLVYVPLHSGNLMLNIRWEGFFLTYQHNSYSKRFTTSSNDVSSRNEIYPYFMNNLIAGKDFRIWKVELKAEIKIYNLFNETYHSVLYRPMPGRNYMLLLRAKI